MSKLPYSFAAKLAGVIFCITALISTTQAQTVFDNGADNTLNSAAVDVQVLDGANPTTLNVVEGAMITEADGPAIGVFGASILNFTGGSVDGTIEVNDTATATIAGEFGEDLIVAGGMATLADGGVVGDDLFVRAGSLTMTGGVASDELFVEGTATAIISGGVVEDDLNAVDNSMITVSFLTLEDTIDATDSGVVVFNDGLVEGGIEAADTSMITINGGSFPNIFSGGEVGLASGGIVNITGGTFGEAGSDEGGSIGSSLGGTVNFTGGTIAGVADGTAPPATVNAVLGGTTNLSNVEFGDLVLEAGNAGVLTASNFKATSVTVNPLAEGTVIIEGGEADELAIVSDLKGNAILNGGDFGSISVTLEGESTLTIVGDQFTFNGTPIEEVDALLGDADAFIEETGELRVIAGDLGGVLADGSEFNISLTRSFIPPNASSVFLQVPEPASSSLAFVCVLVSGCLRRRRK